MTPSAGRPPTDHGGTRHRTSGLYVSYHGGPTCYGLVRVRVRVRVTLTTAACETSHVMLSALPIRSASVAIRLVSRPVCAALVGPARSTWVRAAAAWEHRVWEPWVLGRGAAKAGGCSVSAD